MEEPKNTSRRKFIENSALLGALGAIGASQFLQSCKPANAPVELNLKPFLDIAPDGELIKAGVIGCGGRGTGAAINFLDAGPNLKIHAVADLFQDRVDSFRKRLKDEKGAEIDDANVFLGFDAYKRLLDSDVDYVILATPPYFRPVQFEAAVEARKNIFMEKPVAVDPVGARAIMAASRQAEAAGLCVVTGTQRRHGRNYTDVYKQVRTGAIGDIVSANAYWNMGKLWHRRQQPTWTEMEYMIRDWVNWTWLSGDHIVEQHIHNIDVINWFTGKFPVKAVGMGSRQRRLTGDCYDNFSVDFVYDDEIHMGSMCRQINDCANSVSEYIRGTEGYTNCADTIWNPDSTVKYEYEYPLNADGEVDKSGGNNHLVQEHIDLITAIRTGEQVVQAETTAKSTLTAIMGRQSAYTGQEVTWEEMMSSDLKIGPDEITMGPVGMEAIIPVAGSTPPEE